MDINENRGGKSVIRAIQLLGCFSEQNPVLTLNELANRTGLNEATILRLMAALEETGCVHKASDASVYTLGLKLLELGKVVINTISLRRVALPIMEELSHKTAFNTNLGIFDNDTVLYLARHAGANIPDVYFHPGKRLPLYTTGIGKVLLAFMPEPDRKEVIERINLLRLTPHTIVDKQILLEEIEQVLIQGYALEKEEGTLGTWCIAVPIRDMSNRVIAGLSLSSTHINNKREKILDYLDALGDAAVRISNYLGHGVSME